MDPGSRPDQHGRTLSRAGQALRSKRPDEARRLLEDALARSPDEPRAQNLLGLSYFKLGRLDDAARLYERLVERFPREPSLAVNLGLVRLRQGDIAEAEACFRGALERSPDHRRAHCYLGLALYRRGELVRAREHFLAGEAHDLADRVERLTSSEKGEGGESHLLRDVSVAAEAALTSDVQPFRSVDPGEAGGPRDDGAWRAAVRHDQPVPVPEPADASSLRAGIRSSVGAPSSSPRPAFRTFVGTQEVRAVAAAAEEVAPEPPELVYSVDLSGRSLLTVEEVEALESGLGRPGFVAGPGGRAKLTLEAEGAVRSDAWVLALGRRELRADGERPGWLRVRGPTVLLLSVDGLAVALRQLGSATFAPGVLRGHAGSFQLEVDAEGRAWLEGRGSALIRSPGIPLAVPLAPDRRVLCAAPALLGWSSRVAIVPSGEPGSDERLEARGPGWILVGERGTPEFER